MGHLSELWLRTGDQLHRDSAGTAGIGATVESRSHDQRRKASPVASGGALARWELPDRMRLRAEARSARPAGCGERGTGCRSEGEAGGMRKRFRISNFELRI